MAQALPSKEDIGALFRDAMASTDEGQETISESVTVEEQEQDILDTRQEVAAEEEQEDVIEDEESQVADDEEQSQEESEGTNPGDFVITDLAAAFGDDVDPAKVYDVQVPISADESVTIGQLKDSWKDSAAIAKERDSITQQQQQFEFQKQQASEHFGQLSQVSERGLELRAMLYAVEQEDQNTDWNAELQRDSGAASFKKQKIDEAKQKISLELQQTTQQEQQLRADEQNQLIQQNMQMMGTKVESWQDPQTRSKEWGEIFQHMCKEYGFQPSEMSQLFDYRTVMAFRDLVQLKAAQGKVEEVKSKLSSNVRPLKRGKRTGSFGSTRPSKEAVKLKRISAATKRGKATKDLHEKASAVAEIFNAEGIE